MSMVLCRVVLWVSTRLWPSLLLGFAFATVPNAGLAATRALLTPTPLILKDGRVANVAIHTLRFDRGASHLDASAEDGLSTLIRSIGTDCFLTAQVVGHAAAGESGDGLASHRLARARADAVQARLISAGLPEASIASVWDWQFMVSDRRATIWVFSLSEGETCEGEMLPAVARVVSPRRTRPGHSATASTAPGIERRMAAARPVEPTSPPAAPAARSTTSKTTPSPAANTREAAPSGVARAREMPNASGERADNPAPAAVVPEGRSSRVEASLLAAVVQRARQEQRANTGPAVTRTIPAPASGPTAPQPETPPAPVAQGAAAPKAATQPTDREERAVAGVEAREAKALPSRLVGETLVVSFASNSSYFSTADENRIRALIRRLEPGRPYVLELVVTVGKSKDIDGATTVADAERYHRWLAQRRLARVRSVFEEPAKDLQVEFRHRFEPNTSKRQVTIRVAPAATV